MLKAENSVLVIIDVQGKLATLMHQKEAFFENVVRIIKGARVLDIPVIWNEQLPDKLGPTITEVAEALSGAAPMVKNTFSCYGNKAFIDRLKSVGRRQILLAGMETHVCVYQTALDLLNEGYEVYLVVDAVSSRTPENKQTAIEAIKDAGAKITSVEMALFELLRVAEGNRFRKIIGIVK